MGIAFESAKEKVFFTAQLCLTRKIFFSHFKTVFLASALCRQKVYLETIWQSYTGLMGPHIF